MLGLPVRSITGDQLPAAERGAIDVVPGLDSILSVLSLMLVFGMQTV